MKPYLLALTGFTLLSFMIISCRKNHSPKLTDTFLLAELPVTFKQGHYNYEWQPEPDSIFAKNVDSCIVTVSYYGDSLIQVDLKNPEPVPQIKTYLMPYRTTTRETTRTIIELRLILDSSANHYRSIGGKLEFNKTLPYTLLEIFYFDHYIVNGQRVSPSVSTYIQALK